jgi:hypothetical protein
MIGYTHYWTDPRVIREAEAAMAGGFDVDFVALRGDANPAQEWIKGVRVIHLNQGRYRGDGLFWYMLSYVKFFLRCFLKTSWLQLGKRYLVVHVNNMPDFFVFCALLPKLMGARILLDIHDPMPNTFVSKFKGRENGFFFRLLLWQERVSASFADQVLTVSDPVKDYVLVKQHGLAPDSIQVIANFADDELFPLRDPRRFDAGLRLVFHGTILERNGWQNAMLGLARMRHRDRITVKIIGEGDYSEELKDMIVSLRLGKIVDFENRVYPVHEIPRVLEHFNLGFVPLEISSITNYALPLKLLEYLSLGMTSVTVRNVAIGYYFGEDDLLFYQPDDPDSLSALLDRLAEQPDLLYRYQQRAVILREKFLWSREKRKYIALLNKLANGVIEGG